MKAIITTITTLLLLWALCPGLEGRDRILGMRVDPAYFYEDYFKTLGIDSAEKAAKLIIRDSRKAGVNTIFFYVYNSKYGAFYPTDYKYTTVEQGFGRQDILRHLLKGAKELNINVVGVIPINNFFTAWQWEPDWRIKITPYYDLSPTGQHFLLSALERPIQEMAQGVYQRPAEPLRRTGRN